MALVGIKSKLSFPSIDKPVLVRFNVPLLPTKVPFKSEKSFSSILGGGGRGSLLGVELVWVLEEEEEVSPPQLAKQAKAPVNDKKKPIFFLFINKILSF